MAQAGFHISRARLHQSFCSWCSRQQSLLAQFQACFLPRAQDFVVLRARCVCVCVSKRADCYSQSQRGMSFHPTTSQTRLTTTTDANADEEFVVPLPVRPRPPSVVANAALSISSNNSRAASGNAYSKHNHATTVPAATASSRPVLAQFAHLQTNPSSRHVPPPPPTTIPSTIDMHHGGHDFLNISTLDADDSFHNERMAPLQHPPPHPHVVLQQPGLSYIQGPYQPRPFPAGLGVPPPPAPPAPPAPAAAATVPLQPQNDALELHRKAPPPLPPPTATAPPAEAARANQDDVSFSIAVVAPQGNPSISQLTTPAFSQLDEASTSPPSLPHPQTSSQSPSLIVEEPPYGEDHTKDASETKRSRRTWILGGTALLLLIVIVAVVASTTASSQSRSSPVVSNNMASQNDAGAAAPMAPASGPTASVTATTTETAPASANSPTSAPSPPSPPTAESNRAQAIVAFINNITLSGRTIALPAQKQQEQQSISAEDRALEWIIASDPTQWTVANDFRLTQRYALATLWIQQVESDTDWADRPDECQWPGNSCAEVNLGSEVGTQRAIASMELENKGLTGSLSPDLGLLSNLVLFNVGNNSLGGTIPSTLGRWTNIETLDLSNNDLIGKVPEDVCNAAAVSNVLRVDCSEVDCGCCAECKESPSAVPGTAETMPPTASPTRSAQEATTTLAPESAATLTPYASPTPLPMTTPNPTMEKANRAASIVNFINSITLSGRGIANPTTSTEALATEEVAVQWLIVNDPLQLTPDTNIKQFRLKQRYALLTLMVQQSGWESQWVLSSSGNHECEWTGIFCGQGDFGGDVGVQRVAAGIDLPGSLLRGSIPADLGLLSNLRGLDVSYNSLGGSLPQSIGNWLQLQQFWANDNSLTGTIPEAIVNWSNIERIQVGNNQFTGSVPDGICDGRASLTYVGADCFSEVTCNCCTGCADFFG
jgi:Leucine-rich repeat (LRR) protein